MTIIGTIVLVLSLCTSAQTCFDCRNGPMAGQCEPKCNCDVNGELFYFGDSCELVNLNVTTSDTNSRTVLFTWKSPPDLHGAYTFIYRKTKLAPSVVNFKDVNMVPEDTTELLYRLDSGEIDYTVCLMDTKHAHEISNNETLILYRISGEWNDCMETKTDPSVLHGYTLTMYIVSGYIIIVYLSLVFLQMWYSKKTEYA